MEEGWEEDIVLEEGWEKILGRLEDDLEKGLGKGYRRVLGIVSERRAAQEGGSCVHSSWSVNACRIRV